MYQVIWPSAYGVLPGTLVGTQKVSNSLRIAIPGQYLIYDRVICGDYINKYILGKCQLFGLMFVCHVDRLDTPEQRKIAQKMDQTKVSFGILI